MPNKNSKKANLVLKDGTKFVGISFGAEKYISVEVVFTTGIKSYKEYLNL